MNLLQIGRWINLPGSLYAPKGNYYSVSNQYQLVRKRHPGKVKKNGWGLTFFMVPPKTKYSQKVDDLISNFN